MIIIIQRIAYVRCKTPLARGEQKRKDKHSSNVMNKLWRDTKDYTTLQLRKLQC